MKHLVLTLAVAALVLPAAALGKGPTEASISGPGGGGGDGLTFGGDPSSGPPIMNLAEQAGFFPAVFGLVFGQEPNPMLASRPKGDLGPKYSITYTVPGPNNETWKIRQDVYPYATPAAVTYMERGQTVFGGQETRGGWFQADSQLKDTLVSAGLPPQAAGVSSEDSVFSTGLLGLLGAALLLVSATAVILRRRAHPAAA